MLLIPFSFAFSRWTEFMKNSSVIESHERLQKEKKTWTMGSLSKMWKRYDSETCYTAGYTGFCKRTEFSQEYIRNLLTEELKMRLVSPRNVGEKVGGSYA